MNNDAEPPDTQETEPRGRLQARQEAENCRARLDVWIGRFRVARRQDRETQPPPPAASPAEGAVFIPF